MCPLGDEQVVLLTTTSFSRRCRRHGHGSHWPAALQERMGSGEELFWYFQIREVSAPLEQEETAVR